MTVENTSNDRRNCGVDALRLFSMLLIVVLHVLGQGGVLAAAQGARGADAWLMESAAMCAVNCFALVSGYVGYSAYERRWRPAGYLRLWLGVLTYSFGITLLARLVDPRLAGGRDLLKSLLPVTTRIDRPKRILGYRRLVQSGALPWPGQLNGHEFHYSSARQSRLPPLFAATDARGDPLPPMGGAINRVMGSYAHVVDAA